MSQKRPPPGRKRRMVRRGMLGLVFVSAIAGLVKTAQHPQWFHNKISRTPTTIEKSVPKIVHGRKSAEQERFTEKESARPRMPSFVEKVRQSNRYMGTVEEVVAGWTMMAKEARAFFVKRKNETGREYFPMPITEINQICKNAGSQTKVDPALLKAIAKTESQFDPLAVSPVLAMGAFQIRPNTLAELDQNGTRIANPFDPLECGIGCGKILQLYTERAAQLTKNVGTTKKPVFKTTNRNYEYNGKTVSFSDLPIEIRYGIILRIYNAGADNVFTNNMLTPKKTLDAIKMADNSYARNVLANYHRYQQEGL